MADNIRLNPGSGGALLGTDEVSVASVSVQAALVKLGYGADGSWTAFVQETKPLPVVANLESNVIQLGAGEQATPQFAKISLTATGTIVPAVSNKKIRVLSLLMTIDTLTGDEKYTFKSGAGGTALTGDLGDADAASAVLVIEYSFSPLGHFETASGSLLELSLAVTAEAEGSLVYIEV